MKHVSLVHQVPSLGTVLLMFFDLFCPQINVHKMCCKLYHFDWVEAKLSSAKKTWDISRLSVHCVHIIYFCSFILFLESIARYIQKIYLITHGGNPSFCSQVHDGNRHTLQPTEDDEVEISVHCDIKAPTSVQVMWHVPERLHFLYWISIPFQYGWETDKLVETIVVFVVLGFPAQIFQYW